MGTVVMCDMRVVLHHGIQKQQLTRLKLSRDQICLTGRVPCKDLRYLKKKRHLLLKMLNSSTLKTTWYIKGCGCVKQRFDGNIRDVLSDMQALVFLLGCKNKSSLKKQRLSGENKNVSHSGEAPDGKQQVILCLVDALLTWQKLLNSLRYSVTQSNSEDSKMCENDHANWVIACIKQVDVCLLTEEPNWMFSVINYLSQKCYLHSIPKWITVWKVGNKSQR